MCSQIQLSDIGNLVPTNEVGLFRTRISNLLGRSSLNFPGAQPVSFARRHLQELQNADYFLCEKSDGVRCLLYLTDLLDGEDKIEAKMLIDRKNDYYYISNPSFHFPLPDGPDQTFHTDTLLDGELVIDTLPSGEKRTTYLVFDCLAQQGESLLQKSLDKRLGHFYQDIFEPYKSLLDRYPEEKANQPFKVVPKRMEKAYGIEMMFRDILPKLLHANDGLIFTCRSSPYVVGTNKHIIKWKPPSENTIDFRLQLGDFPLLKEDNQEYLDYDACPTLDLQVFYGNHSYKHFDKLYLDTSEWESIKSINQIIDGRVLECYKDESGRWRMKREADGSPRFRDDKLAANHIKTVESVLESVRDAVSEQDLLDVARAIYIKWKQREANYARSIDQAGEQAGNS